jgi:ABC-type cobalamin transport system permease subunit
MRTLLREIWEAGSRFRWIVLAFVFAGLAVAGLLIWQLYETSPARWCYIANANGIQEGCFQVLIKLIEVKDHAITGLLAILGATVLSVVAVTLKVRIDVTGPAGTGGRFGSEPDEPAAPTENSDAK